MRFTYEELKLLSRETLIDLLMAMQTLHPEYDTAAEGGGVAVQQTPAQNSGLPSANRALFLVSSNTKGSWFDTQYNCWYRALENSELNQLKSGNQKIQSIKQLRMWTGCSLKAAKDKIEELERLGLIEVA